MTLEELKASIVDGVTNFPLIVFLLHDNNFIPCQYFRFLAAKSHRNFQQVDSLEELIPVKNALFNVEESDEFYRVLDIPTLNVSSDRLSYIKNSFIVCKKVAEDVKDMFLPYMIDVPKLEPWQIKDYVYSLAKGVPTQKLDDLIAKCGNDIFRLDQEVRKVSIFEQEERSSAFSCFESDGIFSDLSELGIFDLSNAMMRRDYSMISKVMKSLPYIDVEPIGLQKVLTDNFRDVIRVQLMNNPTPEYFEKTYGWKKGKFWAIKYICGYYNKDQLIKIFGFLTSIQFGSIPEDQLISYIISHIIYA